MNLDEMVKLKEVRTPYGNVGSGELWAVGGVLVVLGVILWKSGIFKATSAAADVVKTAAGAASTVVNDTLALPQNITTLVSDIPQVIQSAIEQANAYTEPDIWNDAINGMDVNTWVKKYNLTARVYNMIRGVHAAIPSATYADWGTLAGQAGMKFDANGNVTSAGTTTGASTSSAGAKVSVQASVQKGGNLSFSFSGFQPGAMVSISVVGGGGSSTYADSSGGGGAAFQDNDAAGTYTLKLTDSYGHSATASFKVV